MIFVAIFFFCVLFVFSIEGLQFHGKQVKFNHTGDERRHLTESIHYLIVERNYTEAFFVIDKETTLPPTTASEPSPKTTRYHHHVPGDENFVGTRYRKEIQEFTLRQYQQRLKRSLFFKISEQTLRDQSVAIVVVDKNTYLMKQSDYVQLQGDKVSEYLPEHKYNAGEVVDFPVQVKVASGYKLQGGIEVGFNLYHVERASTLWPTIESISMNPKVLWIDKISKLNLYSRQSRKVHFNVSASNIVHFLPDGEGITIGIADDGIDPSHCAFYDGSPPPSESQSLVPGPHSKIAWIVTSKPGITDYKCSNGCHGSATAGSAVAFDCGITVGTATKARVGLMDFSMSGSDVVELQLKDGPGIRTFYEWIEESIVIGGVTVFSFSFGANTGGLYDFVASECDALALKYPHVTFYVSVGNDGTDGDHLPSSPCLGKNIGCTGAVFGSEYTSVADFSSYGKLPGSGRTLPLFYSPGVSEQVAYGFFNPDNGHNHFFSLSGTSFSAPPMAGVDARYQQYYQQRHGGSKALGPLRLAVMLATSIPVTKRLSTSIQGKVLSNPGYDKYGVPVISYIGMEEQYTFDVTRTDELPEQTYCYSLKGMDAFNVSMAYYDYQSIPFSSVNLVNNLDMKIYLNHHLVFDGRDTRNPHERYRVDPLVPTSSLRVVVYEQDYNFVKTIPFGLYLHTTQLTKSDTCGNCQAVDLEVCENGDGTNFRFCNLTTGLFTDCLPTVNHAIENVMTETCIEEAFQGIKVNGNCMPVNCVQGYYYDSYNSQCRCVPGFRKTDTLVCSDEERFVFSLSEETTIQDSQGGGGGGTQTQSSIGTRATPNYTLQVLITIIAILILY